MPLILRQRFWEIYWKKMKIMQDIKKDVTAKKHFVGKNIASVIYKNKL